MCKNATCTVRRQACHNQQPRWLTLIIGQNSHRDLLPLCLEGGFEVSPLNVVLLYEKLIFSFVGFLRLAV